MLEDVDPSFGIGQTSKKLLILLHSREEASPSVAHLLAFFSNFETAVANGFQFLGVEGLHKFLIEPKLSPLVSSRSPVQSVLFNEILFLKNSFLFLIFATIMQSLIANLR